MKYLWTLRNWSTGETLKKNQKTEPRVRGFSVVDRERILPERPGYKIFRNAQNEQYYAKENAEGSHYQP
jgi:hypothetical protein